jgi:hypothetical protein
LKTSTSSLVKCCAYLEVRLNEPDFLGVEYIYLECAGSLISIKFATRSSNPCCFKPIFSWKICLDGAGPLSCQPRGVSTQECFSATSFQRLVSTSEVQSWAKPRSKKDVHNIEKDWSREETTRILKVARYRMARLYNPIHAFYLRMKISRKFNLIFSGRMGKSGWCEWVALMGNMIMEDCKSPVEKRETKPMSASTGSMSRVIVRVVYRTESHRNPYQLCPCNALLLAEHK